MLGTHKSEKILIESHRDDVAHGNDITNKQFLSPTVALCCCCCSFESCDVEMGRGDLLPPSGAVRRRLVRTVASVFLCPTA